MASLLKLEGGFFLCMKKEQRLRKKGFSGIIVKKILFAPNHILLKERILDIGSIFE
jgi:hypothetical protein